MDQGLLFLSLVCLFNSLNRIMFNLLNSVCNVLASLHLFWVIIEYKPFPVVELANVSVALDSSWNSKEIYLNRTSAACPAC